MEIQIIILTLILSAFFSGIEIAFISANKMKIELSKKNGSISGRILSEITHSPSYFLGTTLVGNNIALIVFGIMMAELLQPLLVSVLPMTIQSDLVVLLLQTVLSTGLLLVISEFIPKVLFRISPNWILNFLAVPLYLAYKVLYPFVWIIVKLSHFIFNSILRIEYSESKPVFNKVDLEHFIKQAGPNQENESELNQEMFENALYLFDVRVRECMVPRMEVEAIDISEGIEKLRELFIQTKLSKILIYEDTIDNILGYAHHYDLFKRPASIQEILYPIPVVPESMRARDLLNIFTKERKSIAWVVDEYGGTAGIVALEDVLEEIFGEIQDEFDEEEFIEKQLAENEYIFSGRLEIDYINGKYELEIPEDGPYETIGGYIVMNNGKIPARNEVIDINSHRFIILNASDTRIETVKVIKLNGEHE